MDLDQILRVYAFLLSLFPFRFRDEYGDEMQSVFADAAAEAVSAGHPSLWILLGRELRDLPRLAWQEHRLERSRPRYRRANPPPPPAPYRWVLPLVGSIAAFFAILIINELQVTGFEAVIESWYRRIGDRPELFPRLVWQLISAGMLWSCIILVIALFLWVLKLSAWGRPLYHRLVGDWTHLSFIFYGAGVVSILVDLDGYDHEAVLRGLALAMLALGAWGYLRAGSRAARFLCLFTATSLAFAILGVGKFSLVPLQSWPGLNGETLYSERRFEALREIASWLWVVAAQLAPWLIRRRPPVLANLALVGLWLILFHPILPYLQVIFTRQEFRLNQIALVGVIGLLIYQARSGGLGLSFGAPPALHASALTMLLGSSFAFILAERLVDINTLSAALFGMAFYGLLGLWLEPRSWRQGMPAALLLIATLPFGEHLQTFVGYPVRLVTARLVQEGLAAFGVPSVGIDTILVFENGISQVDLPCSGVKSLWTGGMFFLAATWIERRRFHRRWLLVGIAFAFLLMLANLARVAVLVTVGQVLGWRLAAEMLHVPLGVLGFAGACAALVWMLRRFVPAADVPAADTGFPDAVRPRWLAPALLLAILVLALLYTPRPSVAAAQSAPELHLPQALSAEAWDFSPGEIEWLSADGPLAASRWRFEWHETRGSLLLITSDTWRAHHRPERCFEAYGLSVDQSYSRLLPGDFPLRLVALSTPRQARRYSAVYWLQSTDRVTDDYATRIWSDLDPQHPTWVLVTILFDTAVDPLDPDLQILYAELRQSVAQSLKGGRVE